MQPAIFEINSDKVELIKRTICRGSSDDELELFVHACKRTGLDPFMRQIYAVKRWDASLKKEVMGIQTGIDGYRLIADRTGRYSPGKETVYVYDDNGRLVAATSYVKKQTPDGTWHEIGATAYYTEYVALTKEKAPTSMWATKGHIMLGKCAEACALRKAFPAELSGIYTKEEMEQAYNPPKDEIAAKAEVTIDLQLPEVPDDVTRRFADAMPESIDPAVMEAYIDSVSKFWKITPEQVKAKGVTNTGDFLANFDKWRKKKAA